MTYDINLYRVPNHTIYKIITISCICLWKDILPHGPTYVNIIHINCLHTSNSITVHNITSTQYLLMNHSPYTKHLHIAEYNIKCVRYVYCIPCCLFVDRLLNFGMYTLTKHQDVMSFETWSSEWNLNQSRSFFL